MYRVPICMLVIISCVIECGLGRFGSQLDDKIVDTKFETMGEVRIDEFSVINDITTLEVVVEDTIGIDELWVLDFQPLDYDGKLPIVLEDGSLSSSRTGTCSSIYRDADWEDNYFDDEYFISSNGEGEKDLYNSFVQRNVTEFNQRQNEIGFSGDLATLFGCQQKDGTNSWNFEIYDEEIQYQSVLYASNVRPISQNWSPALGTNLQVAYVQTHFRLIWRLSRFAILNTSIRSKEPGDKRHFLIIGQPEIIEEVGLITVFFDYAVVDAVYEHGSPNPSKTYLTMGISTRITDGQSTMLSFKNNSLEYIPRNGGNAIDVIHQMPSARFDETPACKSWKLDEVCEQSWYFEFEISLNLTGITQDIPVDATGDFVFAFFTYQCDNLYNKSECVLLDIDPWYLSADVTLQTVVTVIDEQEETIRVNVIEVSNDKGEDLRGGTDVRQDDNVTMTVNFSPAYLRDSFILDLSLFMVCLGADFVDSTRGCLSADEDDRYTGFVSDDFVLDYDPELDPVEITALAALLESEESDEDVTEGNEQGQILNHQDKDGFQWTLAMKATAGIGGGSLYDIWTIDGGLNEMEPDSQIIDDTFPGHYKNHIIDTWQLLQVRKVKVALYSEEEEVLFLIFDAVGSTVETWFSQDRLLDSTFTDIDSDIYLNFFSLAGHSRANLNRRWFINKSYNGCGNDQGWFVVIDGPGVCSWENDIGGPPPQFLYTPETTYQKWREGSTETADVFAIFIEHLYFPVPSLVSTNFIHTQTTPNLYTLIRDSSESQRGDTSESLSFNLLETENTFASTPYYIMVDITSSDFPVIITDDQNDVPDNFTLNSIFYEVNTETVHNSSLQRIYSAVSLNTNNLISYIGEGNPERLRCPLFTNLNDPKQYFFKYTPVWVDIERDLLDYFLRFRELNKYMLSLCNSILMNDINIDELRRLSMDELEEIFPDRVTVYELLASKLYFGEMGLLNDDLYTVLHITTLAPDNKGWCRSEVVYNIIYLIVVTQDIELLDFIDPLGNLNIAMTFIYDLIETTDILLPTAVFQTLTRGVMNGAYNDTSTSLKDFLSDLYDYLAPGSTLFIPYIGDFEEEFYRSFVNIVIGRNATLNGEKLVAKPFETEQPEYIGGRFRQGYIETCHINWDRINQFWAYNSPYYQDVSAYKGGWDTWGEWTTCSLKCGGGVQTRTRQCLDDIEGCSGDSEQTGQCNQLRCDIYINNNNFATQVVFINSTMTSTEAVLYCNDIGGHLPDIDDLNLRSFLLDHMNNVDVAHIETVYVTASAMDETDECIILWYDGNITTGFDCSTKFEFFCQSDFVNIFKVEAGSGVNVYDMWTGSDTVGDAIGTTAQSILSTETYKSHFVEEWETNILIEEVRILLLDDNLKSVWQMTFNGSLTDKFDWFSEEHVLTTQYKNFQAKKTFFSIQGNKRAERRFYISHNYQGCHVDSGWLLVLDATESYCEWEEELTSPQFIYSGGKTHEVWAGNENYARMFVISLKFRNQPALPKTISTGVVAQKYSVDSISPPTQDQQLNFAEYDLERDLHESQFTNKAMSGEKADYTLTAVYRLESKERRRKRDADKDDDHRHRRSLEPSVGEPHIRNIGFSFLGCPEGSMFNPIDRTCFCINRDHEIHRNSYKCQKPIQNTYNNDDDKIEIIIESDRSRPNTSAKNGLHFSLVFSCILFNCILT